MNRFPETMVVVVVTVSEYLELLSVQRKQVNNGVKSVLFNFFMCFPSWIILKVSTYSTAAVTVTLLESTGIMSKCSRNYKLTF